MLGRSMLMAAANTDIWTPANITTALWLDAADSSTVTTVSGKVSEWRDKSGNARHVAQSTADWRPTYVSSGQNGRNIINFAGTELGTGKQRLNNTTAALLRNAGAGSIFVVGRFNLGNAAQGPTFFTVTTSVPNTRLNLAGTTSATPPAIQAGGRRVVGTAFQSIAGTTAATSYGVYATLATYSAATLSVWANGVQENITTSFQTAGVTENDGGGYNVAMDQSGTLPDCDTDIAEIIVLERVPSTTERQQIEGYLAHRWGATGNLPANHPYKSTPPYQ